MNFILIMMLLGYLYRRFFGSLMPRGTLNCGLAGFSAYEGKTVDETKMRMLLLLNQTRGNHATGVYGNQLFKKAEEAKKFIQHPGFNTAVVGAKVVVGHTRAATSGNHDERNNAHPFSLFHTHEGMKKFLHGTHNGGIFPNHIAPLAEKYNLKIPEVDSKLIFEILMTAGYDWDVLGEIEANMAIAFIHEGNLHLYRRNNRPLYIGESDEGVYYSSLETSLLQIGCRGVTDVQPWTMFKFVDGLVDRIWHPKKPTVVSLPEDASTSKAENLANIPSAEREELKRYNKNTIGFKDEYRNGKKKETEEASPKGSRKGTSYGGCISRIKPTSDASITALIHSLSDEALELIDIHEIDMPDQINELRKEHDSEEAILSLNLVTEETKSSKIPQMLVWVDGREDVNSISLDNGLVVLKIPEELVDKPLTIKMADPFTEYDKTEKEQKYNWYATDITVPKGRILEVILTLPFLVGVDRDGDESESGSSSTDGKNTTDDNKQSISESNGKDSDSEVGSNKYQGAYGNEGLEETLDALRGSEDNTEAVPIDELGYDSVTVRVSPDAQEEKGIPLYVNGAPLYANPSSLPIWVVDGYETMGHFIQGSSHPLARILRDFGGPQKYGRDGNVLPLYILQRISIAVKRFLGGEMAKAKINKMKTAEHTFLGSGDLKLKYAGNKSWVQMDTDDYVSTIKTKISEAAERMQYMGEEIDAAREITSGIGPTHEELKDSLIAAQAVIQKMYNEEEMNRAVLQDSIENVLTF
jgi:hypothetical protein